eukprot:gene28881-22359_t
MGGCSARALRVIEERERGQKATALFVCAVTMVGATGTFQLSIAPLKQ